MKASIVVTDCKYVTVCEGSFVIVISKFVVKAISVKVVALFLL